MRLSLYAIAALCVSSASAVASPITYTETTTASGTLGSTTFTNAAITIIEQGDTSKVFTYGTNVYGNTAGTSTITISGVGTANFLNSSFGAIAQEFNAGLEAFGFYDGATGFALAEESGQAIGYNLQSALNPVTGTFVSNGTQSERTSLGALVITSTSGVGTATVASAVTPEPSSFALLGTGLLGFAGVVRKRLA